MDLHEDTLRLMSEAELPVTQICKDCDLTTRWYYLLKAGEIKNPGYQRLQRLHDYLAANRKAA